MGKCTVETVLPDLKKHLSLHLSGGSQVHQKNCHRDRLEPVQFWSKYITDRSNELLAIDMSG